MKMQGPQDHPEDSISHPQHHQMAPTARLRVGDLRDSPLTAVWRDLGPPEVDVLFHVEVVVKFLDSEHGPGPALIEICRRI